MAILNITIHCANPEGFEETTKQLTSEIKQEVKQIKDKYSKKIDSLESDYYKNSLISSGLKLALAGIFIYSGYQGYAIGSQIGNNGVDPLNAFLTVSRSLFTDKTYLMTLGSTFVVASAQRQISSTCQKQEQEINTLRSVEFDLKQISRSVNNLNNFVQNSNQNSQINSNIINKQECKDLFFSSFSA